MMTLDIFTDGGSRGNPGEAAVAGLIFDGKGTLMKSFAECIGMATNNEAEYNAIIKALTLASLCGDREAIVTTDSQLVSNQLSGEYEVKNERLKDLCRQVRELETRFDKVSYKYAPRSHTMIAKADAMLNDALDRAGK